MKRLWIVAFLVLLAAEPCLALSHGIFHRAKTTDPGNIYGGGYVILADGPLTFMGQVRGGVAVDVEVGGRLAITLEDDLTLVTAGGDGQFLFVESSKELPINVSGIGGLDMTFGDDFSAFLLGFGGLIDGRLKLQRGRNIYPQGALIIYYVRTSTNGRSDGDLDVILSGGMVFQITEMLEFVTELRVTRPWSLGIGLNFR